MPKRKLIACSVLKAEAVAILEDMGMDEAGLDAEWISMGLHEEPEKLNAELKRLIAATEGKGYESVVLLFGLCSNATKGLAALDAPLVIPRVHDCISLYLGSAAKYHELHAAEPGTYWFSRGFLHRDDAGAYSERGFGGGTTTFSPEERKRTYESYVRDYGEENAEYLMEAWVDAWKKNYTRAVYLAWDRDPGCDADREVVKALASENGWRYEEMAVDLRLVRMALEGRGPEDELLIVAPGREVVATNDSRAITCGACGACAC